MRRITGLAMAGALLLAGCGADGSEDLTMEDSGTTTAANGVETEAAEDEPAATTSTTEATTTTTEPADLEAMALTIDDMPSGWAVDSDEIGDESPIECINESRALMADQERTLVAFIGTGDRPSFQQRLIGSADRLDQVVEIFDGCGRFEFTFEGSEVEGSVDRLSLDAIDGSDEFYSWRISLTIDGAAIEAITTVSSHGDTLMSLVYLDVLSADTGEFGELAQLAAGKLT